MTVDRYMWRCQTQKYTKTRGASIQLNCNRGKYSSNRSWLHKLVV
jgi:hypothetical protein